jgi:hypothetical protein
MARLNRILIHGDEIMNCRFQFIAPFAIVLIVVCMLEVQHSRSARGEDAAAADALKQVQIEYAQAMLKSAQANLARAREVNARATDTIPASAVRNLEADVTGAEARIKMLQGTDGGAGDSPYLAAAKSALAIAEASLKESQEINSRVAGAVSKSEVDRRQADVDLARARLRVAQLLATAPPAERIEWELRQLQEEVHGLQSKVQLLQYRN